jgi:hypothetical protein
MLVVEHFGRIYILQYFSILPVRRIVFSGISSPLSLSCIGSSGFSSLQNPIMREIFFPYDGCYRILRLRRGRVML